MRKMRLRYDRAKEYIEKLLAERDFKPFGNFEIFGDRKTIRRANELFPYRRMALPDKLFALAIYKISKPAKIEIGLPPQLYEFAQYLKEKKKLDIDYGKKRKSAKIRANRIMLEILKNFFKNRGFETEIKEGIFGYELIVPREAKEIVKRLSRELPEIGLKVYSKKSEIVYPEDFDSVEIGVSKGVVIELHTHGNHLPPSAEDFLTLAEYREAGFELPKYMVVLTPTIDYVYDLEKGRLYRGRAKITLSPKGSYVCVSP